MTLSGVGAAAYSLLLRADGSVVAAGNMPGGSPTPISGTAASEITGASPAVAVVADAFYGTSFAVQSGGATLGWGKVIDTTGVVNVSDLGVGPAPSSTQGSPTAVSQLSPTVEIKACDGYVLARHDDGTIWIMPGKIVESTTGQPTTVAALQVTGLNPIQSLGEPGNGSVSAVSFPVIDSQGNVNVVSIGTWSIQNNTTNITVTATYTIAAVGGLPATSQVVCADNGGGPNCLALGTDNTVWAWGSRNDFGQIGNGTTVGQVVPVQVTALQGVKVTQVAVSSFNAYALADDGTVYAWGDNGYLGQPYTSAINNLVPTQVPNLTGIVEIVARGYDILARDNQGKVWGWGLNSAGELGTGNTSQAVTPTQFLGISLN